MKYSAKQMIYTQPSNVRLATGEEHGFLLTMRGTAHINGQWSLSADDMLICKPRQALELEYTGGRVPLSVIWVRLSGEAMVDSSTSETDILASFRVNPAPVAVVRSQSQLLMLIKSLAMQLISLPEEKFWFATDLLEESTIQMFLAFVLRACVMEDPHRAKMDSRQDNRLSLDDVFAYIRAHLTEEITLEQLEQEFYVSRHHLIREFKKRTGQTVHRYIVRARLDLCRKYIEQGYSITEVYRMGGFGGYNHFFRAFKQVYGMTPKEYYRSIYDLSSPSSETAETQERKL